MPPRALLLALTGWAVGIGGLIHGLHSQRSGAGAADPEVRSRLEAANKELDLLKRENAALRSLAQGGGEVAVPAETIHAVEKELGLRFRSNPVIHSAATEEIRGRAEAAIESGFGPSGADDRQEAWRLLGWIGPQTTLVSQMAAAATAGGRGWFDKTSGEAWVPERWDPESVPNQAALRRLVAEVLLHQNFPPPKNDPGDDAARARTALHQEIASGVERRFLSAKALGGFLTTKEEEDGKLILGSIDPFIRGLAEFAEQIAEPQATALYLKGNDHLHAALRDPAPTTAALIVPGRATASLQLPPFKNPPFLTESAGLLAMLAWLPDAREAAHGLKSDRYALIPDGDESVAVVWDLEATDAAAGERLEIAVRMKNAGILKDGRHMTWTRISSTGIRWINAATREMLDTLSVR
ncbi:MAG: hypothetical protein V4733_07850 [Verrucomicrobiota bacterium]